jgi:hypothetical protein
VGVWTYNGVTDPGILQVSNLIDSRDRGVVKEGGTVRGTILVGRVGVDMDTHIEVEILRNKPF